MGIFLVCQTLTVVEGVAVTSEQTTFAREKEMFKTVLTEFEDEKKPRLQLDFLDAKPPFCMKAESELSFRFAVGLARGDDVARKVSVYFFAPPGFEFPKSSKGPEPGGKYATYVSAEFVFEEDMASPIRQKKLVKIKAPPQSGRYTAAYCLLCEGFFSDHEEFEVIVKEENVPF